MEMRSNKNIRIGDVLKEFGYVTDDDIGAALEYTKTHEGVRLGGALIDRCWKHLVEDFSMMW